MSAVPPNFRKILHSVRCGNKSHYLFVPISLPLITVGISVGVYWESFAWKSFP